MVDEVSDHSAHYYMIVRLPQVHILHESRGSTLEVVVARMKTRGTQVRFVMVSATVPNILDVATWIGDEDGYGPAVVYQVGCLNSSRLASYCVAFSLETNSVSLLIR